MMDKKDLDQDLSDPRAWDLKQHTDIFQFLFKKCKTSVISLKEAKSLMQWFSMGEVGGGNILCPQETFVNVWRHFGVKTWAGEEDVLLAS